MNTSPMPQAVWRCYHLVHNERMEALTEANRVIAQEYKGIEKDMESLREDKGQLNHEIDALISSFSVIDTIENDISQT
jgi:hypothetical protein